MIKIDSKINAINEEVCSAYGLKTDDLKSRTRKRNIVECRQVSWTICKELLKNSVSLDYLGKYIGLNHDHATVLHAIGVVSDLRQSDKFFNSNYLTLINRCKTALELSEVNYSGKDLKHSEKEEILKLHKDMISIKERFEEIIG